MENTPKEFLNLLMITVKEKTDIAFVKKNTHTESHARTYWEGKYAAFREIGTVLNKLIEHEAKN